MRFQELSKKLVVDERNGKIIGSISDCNIRLESFEVQTFTVQPRKRWWDHICRFFIQEKEWVIPVSHIVQIGSDVIVVRTRR